MKLGLSKDISNAQYHAQLGADEHFYSSSQLKTMLEDAETFYKKYISKELEANESNPAFDIGTYFHTAILEPHLLEKECAIFTGRARRGKVWEEFLEENEGKTIITSNDYEKALNLIKAVRNSEVAMALHTGGESEVSLGIEVDCDGYDIFCKGHKLDVKKGWVAIDNYPEEVETIRLKVRCDYINLDKGYIADLKSTTGNAKDAHKTRNKISAYQYDLSAALYVDLFNAYYLTKKVPNRIKTFWWVFASKDYSNCQSYWTGVGPGGEIEMSNIQVGRAKWRKAVLDIAKYQSMEWVIPDEPVSLSAQPWEMEWLEDKSKPKTTKFNNNKIKVKQATQEIDLL